MDFLSINSLQNQINSLSLWYKIKDIMKKSVVVGLFIGLVGVLLYVNNSKPVVSSPKILVSVSDTITDSIFYNRYMVHYTDGNTQVLEYHTGVDIREQLGSEELVNITDIDTLELNIPESKL